MAVQTSAHCKTISSVDATIGSEPLFCTIQEKRCLKLRAAGFGRNGFRPAGLGAAAEFNRRENPAGRGNRYLRRRAEKKDPYPIVSILK
jgi:hypothetical protein